MENESSTDDQQIFGTIKTGPSREIRVTLNRYQGKQRVHVRLYVFGADVGHFIPTRRGVSLQAGQIVEVIEALQVALAAIPSQSQPRAARRETVRHGDSNERSQLEERARRLQAEGQSAAEIAAALGVSRATAYRLLRTAPPAAPVDRDDSGPSGAPAAPGAAA